MAGFPLMAFGAGLGQWAEARQRQQEAAARNKMLELTLSKYRQEMADKQEERASAEKLFGSLLGGGGASIGPVDPTAGAAPSPGGRAPSAPFGAGLPAASSMTAPGDQAALVRKYESGGNYNVGFGGADLSNAPLDETGFPQWAGKQGPAGISHAAGAYQFQPGTWRPYAERLGVRDFSPASQDAVFEAARADQGMKPWAPYNPRLAAALKSGEGASAPSGAPPAEQQVADASGAPQAAAPTSAPSGPIPLPDLRARLNKIIPPDVRGRMSAEALAAEINKACPTCPAVYKLKYLKDRMSLLAPAERERIARETKQYDTQLDAETKMWEAEVRRGEKIEDRTVRRQERAEDRKFQNWDLLTDPTNNQQYYVQKGHPETAVGMDGQPYKPGGAQRLGGAGGQTASAGREADLKAEIARLDNEFAASNPDATPAQKAKAHTENRLDAEKRMTKARTSESRASPANIVMRKLMDEHPEWGGDDLLRAANKITAQQSIERRYGGGQGANQMAALNTVADHLKLMQQYARELRTGDTPFTEIPRLNQIIQLAAKERGLPEVTNFNVARDIMADEVVRLLTSTGGTEADRQGMQSRLAPMMSEYQQTGALTAFERFVAGRFQGLEQGYARNDPQRTKEFRETMLTPEARELFAKHGDRPAATPGDAAPSAPAGRVPPPAAIEMLRKDTRPNARQEFDAIFGQGAAARALGGGVPQAAPGAL